MRCWQLIGWFRFPPPPPCYKSSREAKLFGSEYSSFISLVHTNNLLLSTINIIFIDCTSPVIVIFMKCRLYNEFYVSSATDLVMKKVKSDFHDCKFYCFCFVFYSSNFAHTHYFNNYFYSIKMMILVSQFCYWYIEHEENDYLLIFIIFSILFSSYRSYFYKKSSIIIFERCFYQNDELYLSVLLLI